MLTVKVKKSKWYRGKSGRDSELLRIDRTMCCIGFLARKCGLSRDHIFGHATLEDVKIPRKYRARLNPFLNQLESLYETNDAVYLTDTDRIKNLKDLGKGLGIKFVFVP